jgi:hypothetical protein
VVIAVQQKDDRGNLDGYRKPLVWHVNGRQNFVVHTHVDDEDGGNDLESGFSPPNLDPIGTVCLVEVELFQVQFL